MLAKMPPYLLETDGTLKEWAWPTLQEHYSHRHVSHLYGAWPGDEIDPDRTPQLARAAVIANRRRTFDVLATAVAGETLPAYTRCHRALVGARLKDNVIVDIQLRQLMEQGYISTALRCSREPYGTPVPDAHGGIPAIIMEMLLYSRPGVIEVLPALPPSLVKGPINGMLARTFARIDKLAWDMEARTVDLTITSLRKQDITLIARHGIEANFRDIRRFGGEAAGGQRKLRVAFAGGKTRGDSPEAWQAGPARMGNSGQLNAEFRESDCLRFVGGKLRRIIPHDHQWFKRAGFRR